MDNFTQDYTSRLIIIIMGKTRFLDVNTNVDLTLIITEIKRTDPAQSYKNFLSNNKDRSMQAKLNYN